MCDHLTPRERQIAGLVLCGLQTKEIAARLYVSPYTVGTHITNIYRKCGIRNRIELARHIQGNPLSPERPSIEAEHVTRRQREKRGLALAALTGLGIAAAVALFVIRAGGDPGGTDHDVPQIAGDRSSITVIETGSTVDEVTAQPCQAASPTTQDELRYVVCTSVED